MEEAYRGVKVTIQPGNLQTNERGWFILSWPGHEDERIQSAYKQAQYILIEAREFVDSWLEDGYITVNEEEAGTTNE
jgi:hypothetical protein